MWTTIKEYAQASVLVLAILVILGIGGVLVTGVFLATIVGYCIACLYWLFSSLFLSTEGREKGEEEGPWR